MSFAEELAADRRLVLLRLLVEASGSANESVLHTGLSLAGHRRGVTRDMVRDDMELLAKRGCAKTEWFNDEVLVATITPRGVDAAKGDIEIEGVKRPRIGG